jgi:post-segregation antitoxin (ccd killing protein)
VVMGKLNVYVPDDMETEMRAAGLSASDVLQRALRHELAEIGRREAYEQWVTEGERVYGKPTTEDEQWAQDRFETAVNADGVSRAS